MADLPPPLLVDFDGAVFRPRVIGRVLKYFEPGGVYRINFEDNRSAESHNATMAGIARAWNNLPPEQAKRFPTAKHFRKWLLIQNGFCDTRDTVCDTEDDARRFAVLARDLDSYAVIVVRGNVVTIYTAQSMALKAMGKDTFETAKQLILQQAAEMVGMTVAELTTKPGDDDQHHHPNAPDLPADSTDVQPVDTASPSSPGGSTRPDTAHATMEGEAQHPIETPEQTEKTGDATIPKNYDQYLYYLRAWLSFTSSRDRIEQRYAREQAALWPKFPARVMPEQRMFCDTLVAERLQDIRR